MIDDCSQHIGDHALRSSSSSWPSSEIPYNLQVLPGNGNHVRDYEFCTTAIALLASTTSLNIASTLKILFLLKPNQRNPPCHAFHYSFFIMIQNHLPKLKCPRLRYRKPFFLQSGHNIAVLGFTHPVSPAPKATFLPFQSPSR